MNQKQMKGVIRSVIRTDQNEPQKQRSKYGNLGNAGKARSSPGKGSESKQPEQCGEGRVRSANKQRLKLGAGNWRTGGQKGWTRAWTAMGKVGRRVEAERD